MLDAPHFSAKAKKKKGGFKLPEEFDGKVNKAVLYHAVRALRNNSRQGTACTKTRAEVTGGSRKPWRQKGTGRARQGTSRSPLWPGGGVVFGPKPRDYRTDLPRKVRRAARWSAFNTRANEGVLNVIEALEFEAPKTRQLVELLGKLDLANKKVLILTAETRLEVLRSSNNLPSVRVMRYADASVLDILWSNALVIEESAFEAHSPKRVVDKAGTGRPRRALKASEAMAREAEKKAVKKPAKKAAGKKKESDDA